MNLKFINTINVIKITPIKIKIINNNNYMYLLLLLQLM